MTVEIRYDEEIQVNQKEFTYLVNNHSESCAFRSSPNKNYWFKCWMMKDAPRIAEYLNKSQNQVKYTY